MFSMMQEQLKSSQKVVESVEKMGTYWEKLHGAVKKNYHDEEMREKAGFDTRISE